MPYISTRTVDAKKMTRQEYNDFRGWKLPDDENGADEGFCLKENQPEGFYINWVTKKVFENSYAQADGMTFGMAIEAMKKGEKVARKGWNGKGMYVVIMPGYPHGIEVNKTTQKIHNLKDGDKLKYRPHFQLFTAQKDVAMWSPSGSDALVSDWEILS